MNTFYGEQNLKDSLLALTKEHQIADAYIRGTWINKTEPIGGTKFKGCFYGCMTQCEDNTLGKASELYGLPLTYVHLTENIYENLPEGEWQTFPHEAIERLPVGVDLTSVMNRFWYRLLMDDDRGAISFTKGNYDCSKAIVQCAEAIMTEHAAARSADAAADAADAAYVAARSAAARSAGAAANAAAAGDAAYAACAAGAAYAADAAADAARSAAGAAARSAADAAAAALVANAAAAGAAAAGAARSAGDAADAAARSNHYSWMKNILFECLSEVVAIPLEDHASTAAGSVTISNN